MSLLSHIMLTTDPKILTADAHVRHQHAAKCKKTIDNCKDCQTNIAWFATVPAHVLAVILEQPMPLKRKKAQATR